MSRGIEGREKGNVGINSSDGCVVSDCKERRVSFLSHTRVKSLMMAERERRHCSGSHSYVTEENRTEHRKREKMEREREEHLNV